MPTSPPTIAALPIAPDPADRTSFNPRAYSWSAALPTFGNQIGAVAANVYTNAAEAAAAAASAAASAQSAVLSPGTSATSTTNLTISAGSKTLTIQAGKQFAVGQFVVIASAESPQNYIFGQIISHNSVSGLLSVNIHLTGGGGVFSSWVISLSSPYNFSSQGGDVYGDIRLTTNNNANLPLGITRYDHSSTNGVASIRLSGGGSNSYLGSISFLNTRYDSYNAPLVEALRIDGTGAILAMSSLIGYGPGAGGVVSQPISKSTNVSLHRPSGTVTMHGAAIAPGATVQFKIFNSFAGYSDGVIVSGIHIVNWSDYILRASIVPGEIIIQLKNDSAVSLSQELVFVFLLVRGANS